MESRIDIFRIWVFFVSLTFTLCNYPDKNKIVNSLRYLAVCPPLEAEIKVDVQSESKIKQEITRSGLKQEVAKSDAQVGEGCVVNVQLTDEDGTQIQATMFHEVARNFIHRFKVAVEGLLHIQSKF